MSLEVSHDSRTNHNAVNVFVECLSVCDCPVDLFEKMNDFDCKNGLHHDLCDHHDNLVLGVIQSRRIDRIAASLSLIVWSEVCVVQDEKRM